LLTQKGVEKQKLPQSFPGAGETGVPIIFSSKGQRSRSSDVKNLKRMTHISRFHHGLQGWKKS